MFPNFYKKKNVRERKLALCKLYSRGSWIENRRKSVPDESEICEKTVSPLQKGGERKGGGTVIQQCSLHLLCYFKIKETKTKETNQ